MKEEIRKLKFEEKNIKIVKDLLSRWDYGEQEPYEISFEEMQAVLGILNLYVAEKEKNKELEYGLYETQESYKLKKRELELNLQNFSKIYISKDKIKEVIKDLEKFDINYYDAKTLKEAFEVSLLELLEE